MLTESAYVCSQIEHYHLDGEKLYLCSGGIKILVDMGAKKPKPFASLKKLLEEEARETVFTTGKVAA